MDFASKGELATAVAQLWRELLAVEVIEPDDDFFRLGGDSLNAVTLMTKVEERFGVAFDTVVIFEHPNVQAFAGQLAEALARQAEIEEGVL